MDMCEGFFHVESNLVSSFIVLFIFDSVLEVTENWYYIIVNLLLGDDRWHYPRYPICLHHGLSVYSCLNGAQLLVDCLD